MSLRWRCARPTAHGWTGRTSSSTPGMPGVDSGISYESQDQPTSHNQPIKRVTSQHPPDENNPFFKSEGGPLKPLAKLSIQKLREYKKSCSDDLTESKHQFVHKTFGESGIICVWGGLG